MALLPQRMMVRDSRLSENFDAQNAYLGRRQLPLQVGDLRLQAGALGPQLIALVFQSFFPLGGSCLSVPQARLRCRLRVAVQLCRRCLRSCTVPVTRCTACQGASARCEKIPLSLVAKSNLQALQCLVVLMRMKYLVRVAIAAYIADVRFLLLPTWSSFRSLTSLARTSAAARPLSTARSTSSCEPTHEKLKNRPAACKPVV